MYQKKNNNNKWNKISFRYFHILYLWSFRNLFWLWNHLLNVFYSSICQLFCCWLDLAVPLLWRVFIFPVCTVDFELWHLELITALVVLVSSCRYLLLKTWPDFAESSEAANQQVAQLIPSPPNPPREKKKKKKRNIIELATSHLSVIYHLY